MYDDDFQEQEINSGGFQHNQPKQSFWGYLGVSSQIPTINFSSLPHPPDYPIVLTFIFRNNNSVIHTYLQEKKKKSHFML